MEEKWTSLCWLAHLSVRITCCLCWNDNTKKRHKNTDPCRRGFCPAVLLLWIGLLYLVLSVGHGAIERPLLKLEVVHVQLLCEHAAWRHSDLVGDGTYPMLLIRHDIKDTHSESALVQRSGNKKHIWHSRFVSCYFLTWWAFFFFSQNSTHHSWVFDIRQCRYQCCGEDVCTWKKKEAQRLVQQWLPAIDDNPNSIISTCWVWTKCDVKVFIPILPNDTNISLNSN